MVKNHKGFTLTEVMIVVIILGLIGFFVVPDIVYSISNNKKTTDLANAKLIYNAAAQVLSEKVEWEVPWEIPDAYTVIITLSELQKKDDNTRFTTSLLKELEGAVPIPRYRGADVGKVEFFVLKIDKEGNIAVLTGSDSSDFTSVEVAPVPNIAFQPKR